MILFIANIVYASLKLFNDKDTKPEWYLYSKRFHVPQADNDEWMSIIIAVVIIHRNQNNKIHQHFGLLREIDANWTR